MSLKTFKKKSSNSKTPQSKQMMLKNVIKLKKILNI